MRTDADRSEKYTAKYVATTVGLKVAASLPTMKSNFAANIASMIAAEVATQTYLNTLGTVAIVLYPTYYNFAREIQAKINKGLTGAGLTAEAINIYDKYTSYSLVAVNLQGIALDVFGIVIP